MSQISSSDSTASNESGPACEVDYPLETEVEVPNCEGKLTKKVLKEGTGTKPLKDSTVTVHYVGTLEDGTKFDSSRDRNEYFEFQLGRGRVIKGWDKGVATMKVGEKAILKCAPDYAYGSSGSPPTIPPNSTLYFEVELIAWSRETDVSANKDRTLMKNTLQEGVDYQEASFEAEVTLDLAIYLGKYEGSTINAPSPVFEKKSWAFEVGSVELPPFMEQCLSTMKKNENAIFSVKNTIALKCDAFNIPSSTASADSGDVAYSYHIILHDLSQAKTWDFEGLEKIKQGLIRKDQGNDAFKNGNLVLAEKKYLRGLEFVETDYGLKDEVKPEALKARVTIWSNLAQVSLSKKDYKNVISYCNKILKAEPANAKALFRRAKAHEAGSDWDLAKKDLEAILFHDKDNVDAKKLLETVKNNQKEYNRTQKSLFKKMFE